MSETIAQIAGLRKLDGLHMGIEIEVENGRTLDRHEPTKYWNIIRDASLRNDGREFVTKVPVPYAEVEDALDEVDVVIREHHNLTVSSRCGVHVHINARDLTPEKVGHILATYVAVESAMYNFGGKDRYSNIYCPGVTASLEQLEVMRKVLGTQSEFISACHDWCKYTGINLRTILNLGTVEFRAHEGTLNAEKLIEWTSAIKNLYDYAMALDNTDQLLEDAKLGADVLASKVFGDMASLALHDGIYEKYYNNNIINLIDLLSGTEQYEPELSDKAQSPDSDVQSIVNQINELLGG